jgi:alcohol dehydrogenase
MKAAQISGYGGKEVVQVTDSAPKPSIEPGQVLVEVAAAGVNPFDLTVRQGHARQMVELDFPATLGGDVSGTVSEIGSDVSGFQVGQAVYGQAKALSGHGSFAEYAPVPAAQLAAKPDSLDFTASAAVPLVASSAYQALVDHIDLQVGQKILIHGGAGGIGSLAIQLAKYLGAYVATTAAKDDTEFVKSLGADEVIDYKQQDFSRTLKDYDAVFDTVGGETNSKSYRILKPGGSLVSMVAKPDEDLVKKHSIKYTAQFSQVTTERLTKLAGLFDNATLKPEIDKVFPLDQAAEALEYLKTGHPRGKVVIKIK